MKWLYAMPLALLVFALGADAQETSRPGPLACPQCGLWQVSGASGGELVGEIVVVDDKRVIIPGCGDFEYMIARSTATPQPHDRYDYDLSLSMTMRKPSFLCEAADDSAWRLDVRVSGHFREGGTADFSVRPTAAAEPILSLTGWNMDREDPCAAGSGMGTGACMEIANAILYKALSARAKSAYQILIGTTPAKPLPSFNAERFSATIAKFCTHREKHSGGGAWPTTWASVCEADFLSAKFKEFVAWHTCAQKELKAQKASVRAKCKFPGEYFDRKAKLASEP